MPSPIRRTIAASILSLIACVASGGESSTPPHGLTQAGLEVRPVGSGTLKWFGLDIYDATLWTSDGSFSPTFDRTVAFTLTYRRDFSRDRLIFITRRAWDELALASAAQQDRWGRELETIWVDVRKGSELTTVVIPQQETRFYDNERFLGRIADPAFGPAFLRIWLDERVADTALGDLRTQLLAADHSSHASKRER